MKSATLTTAFLLVVALASWPAVAEAPAQPPAPEEAAPAQVVETPAADALPADLLLEPALAPLPAGQCNCPDVYDPVCGSNGVTYPNACVARCSGVRSYTEGACGATF